MTKVHRASAVLLAGILTTLLVGVQTSAFAGVKGPHNLMTWLSPTGTTEDAWGKAKYKFVRKFSRLRIEAHGLPPGEYDVNVGGTVIGGFTVQVSSSTGDELGKFVMDSRTAGAVSFDPRGASIQVVNRTTGLAELESGHFPATKAEEMEKTEIEASFVATTLAPAAQGEAEFREFRGRSKFEVEVSGLPAGTYDLLVGGNVKGQISVAADGRGEIEFDSLPDGVGDDDDQGEQGDDDQGNDDGEDEDLLLTFDPRGQAISVVQGADVFLTIDVFPAS